MRRRRYLSSCLISTSSSSPSPLSSWVAHHASTSWDICPHLSMHTYQHASHAAGGLGLCPCPPTAGHAFMPPPLPAHTRLAQPCHTPWRWLSCAFHACLPFACLATWQAWAWKEEGGGGSGDKETGKETRQNKGEGEDRRQDRDRPGQGRLATPSSFCPPYPPPSVRHSLSPLYLPPPISSHPWCAEHTIQSRHAYCVIHLFYLRHDRHA